MNFHHVMYMYRLKYRLFYLFFLKNIKKQIVTDKVNKKKQYLSGRLTPEERWRLRGIDKENIKKSKPANMPEKSL